MLEQLLSRRSNVAGETAQANIRLDGLARMAVVRLAYLPLIARLPAAPLQFALGRVVSAVVERHAGLAVRLATLGSTRLLIEVSDLPFAFLLVPGHRPPQIRIIRSGDRLVKADARIRSDLATLIALAEGKVDGDALFFARRLEIEGETETVLLLRNVLDSVSIDLRQEILAAAGVPDTLRKVVLSRVARAEAFIDRLLARRAGTRCATSSSEGAPATKYVKGGGW